MRIETIASISVLDDFFPFLRSHDALENFVEAVKTNAIRSKKCPMECFKFLFTEHDPANWVSVGFAWDKTKQGIVYWHDLDCEWNTRIKRNGVTKTKILESSWEKVVRGLLRRTGTLMGKWYRVTDNSFNRECTEANEWVYYWTHNDPTHTCLNLVGDGYQYYLILSDAPVAKEVRPLGRTDGNVYLFIKIYCPDEANPIHWVLYNEKNVENSGKQ